MDQGNLVIIELTNVKKLNYLVQNINKMITEEEEVTMANKRKIEELTKISTNFLKALEEKIKTHQKMIKHIRQQKAQVQKVEKKVDTGKFKLALERINN